jgi:hypothetical protein
MTDRLKRIFFFAVTALPLTPVRLAKRREGQQDTGKLSRKSGEEQ